MTRAGEQLMRFGSPLDGAGFAAARAIRHLVAGDDFQQLREELLLFLFGTGLRDNDTELADGIDGAFEAGARKDIGGCG